MRPIPLSLLLLLLASTALYHVEAEAEPQELDEYTKRAYMKPDNSTPFEDANQIATNVCIEDIYDKTLSVPYLKRFRTVQCDFKTHVCSKEVVGKFIRSECVPKADRSCSKYCLDSASCCCAGNLCTLHGTAVYSKKPENGKPQWGAYVQKYESVRILNEENKLKNKMECYSGHNLAKGEKPSGKMACLFHKDQACYALAVGERYSYGCKMGRQADNMLFPLGKDSDGTDMVLATCTNTEKCMCNTILCNFTDADAAPLSPENPNPNNNGTSDPDHNDDDVPPKEKPSSDAPSPSLTLAILLSCIILI